VFASSGFLRVVFYYMLFKHSVELSSKKLRVGFSIIVQPLKENIAASGANSRDKSFAIKTTLTHVAQNELRTHIVLLIRPTHSRKTRPDFTE
jgi:hypothetical protein